MDGWTLPNLYLPCVTVVTKDVCAFIHYLRANLNKRQKLSNLEKWIFFELSPVKHTSMA